MQFEIKNEGNEVFVGWYRTVVNADDLPTHNKGILDQIDGKRFVISHRYVNDHNRILDLELKLAPGQKYIVDTKNLKADDWAIPPIPKDPNFFGWPEINGVPMGLQSLTIDGAFFVVRYGVRHVPLIATIVELRYSPGSGYAEGWISCTASNPTVPDMTAPMDVVFTMKDVAIQPWNISYIGDGQRRLMLIGVPFDHQEESSAAIRLLTNKKIVGHGVKKIGYDKIAKQARFNPIQWKQQHSNVRESIKGYDMVWPPIGVTPNSTQTGDQETQGYMQGFESMYPGGIGAEIPRFWSAMGQARQPCHYLMQNGALMMPEDFPDAMWWQGRPLWINKKNDNPSWFLLGKQRQINVGNNDTQGWHGPDREHMLIHDIASAYTLSGETCLLDELRQRAINFLMEDTVETGLSTSGPDASRSAGWRGMMIAWLLDLIPREDPLWKLVAQRWADRVEKVYWPAWNDDKFTNAFQSKPQEIAGWPFATFLYQMSVQAYGMMVACDALMKEYPEIMAKGMQLAVQAAETVLLLAYQIDGQTDPLRAPPFKEFELLGLRSQTDHADWRVSRYRPSVDAHSTGWFRHAWLPMCLPVVARKSSNPELVGLAKSLDNTLSYEYCSGTTLPQDWWPEL